VTVASTFSNFHRLSPVKGGWKVPQGQRLKYVANQGYHTEAIPGYTPPVKTTPLTLDQRVQNIVGGLYKPAESLIATQAAQLQAEAAARQANYQAAYASAAKTNAAMGADVQKGWNEAGSAVQGLAGALTGGIGAQTQASVASTDQALANMGAPATHYDPTTQAGVESYYGGYLPGRQFAQLGGIGRQFMNEAGIGLAEQGKQESLAAMKQTNFEILKNQTQALADLAAKRPDTYATIRGLFATEKQNDVTNQIAKAELTARQLTAAQDLKFKYAELAQNAKTEAEKLEWQRKENEMDRQIDKINADANATQAGASNYSAHHPSSGQAKYSTGTYQQKASSVLQDELQNVQNTYIPKRDDGVFDKKTGKWKGGMLLKYGPTGAVIKKSNGTAVLVPYSHQQWIKNQRILYREHMFQNLWSMIEGNIAFGNKEKAKKYLRSRLNKVAMSWDPHAAWAAVAPDTQQSAIPNQAAGSGTKKVS